MATKIEALQIYKNVTSRTFPKYCCIKDGTLSEAKGLGSFHGSASNEQLTTLADSVVVNVDVVDQRLSSTFMSTIHALEALKTCWQGSRAKVPKIVLK